MINKVVPELAGIFEKAKNHFAQPNRVWWRTTTLKWQLTGAAPGTLLDSLQYGTVG